MNPMPTTMISEVPPNAALEVSYSLTFGSAKIDLPSKDDHDSWTSNIAIITAGNVNGMG